MLKKFVDALLAAKRYRFLISVPGTVIALTKMGSTQTAEEKSTVR